MEGLTFEQLPAAVTNLTKEISEIKTLLLLKVEHQNNEKSDEWLDLNTLVKYDPAKRGKSTWYSKISRGEVPYHKKGKKVFFLKSEIDNWLKSGRKLTNDEVDAAADKYFAKK